MVAGKHDIVLGQTCPDGTLLSMCVNVELILPRLMFVIGYLDLTSPGLPLLVLHGPEWLGELREKGW
jgi:hypothetical protein